MRHYRIDFLRRDSGQIGHTYRFSAADDADAMRFASVWVEDAPMELWHEDVRLRRWDRPH